MNVSYSLSGADSPSFRLLLLWLLLLSGQLAHGQASTVSAASRAALFDSLTQALAHQRYPNVRAVLVSHQNKLVYAQYPAGYSADSLQDTRSAFKSITSLLVGIALDKGYLQSVQQRAYSFFPAYAHGANWDARKANMTLQHLLEMKTGFACEEFNGTQDCEEAMTATPDWVTAALDLPLACAPGTQWSYTSAAPVVLGGVLAQATHQSVIAFAARYLFEPLGITHYRWTTDPAGQGMTAGSFYLRPADLLKIGEMVAQRGRWHGRRIVSARWLRESMAPRTLIPAFSFVGSSRTKLAQPQPTYYGYYWYREGVVTATSNREVLFASGNGGQYVMLVPDLQLVVVFMGGNYGSWKAKLAFAALAHYIIPAFEHPHKRAE
ncbi:serine hydrolase domain-containing protein [Hymenobacter negativus]|uniref:Beta-lactamase family protein n=1 Tax=Hymenobacter negativus TaxID=2795026 RepID=A0ABS3QLN7_9BACT|nr:serine hydrolase domain-containing protein [Hymenobacter negativus]MBO2012166.1 beta-lactamase family protein [Hymenobacter negativus]